MAKKGSGVLILGGLGLLAAVGAVAIASAAPPPAKKQPGPQPPQGGGVQPPDQGAVPQGVSVYVDTYPQAGGGEVYGIDPMVKSAILAALPNWYVSNSGVLDTQSSVANLRPRSVQEPPSRLGADVAKAIESGRSVLVSPSLAVPSVGMAEVVYTTGDPWALSTPVLAVLSGAGPYASPPGPPAQGAPGTPGADDQALAGLDAPTRLAVQHLGAVGPLLAMTSMATALDGEGQSAAAQWLRAKAQSRADQRRAGADAQGGWSYRIVKGQKNPGDFALAYVGDASRWQDLPPLNPGLTGATGWTVGRLIRIPSSGPSAWPDPETIDPAALVYGGGGVSPAYAGGGKGAPAPDPGQGGAPGWASNGGGGALGVPGGAPLQGGGGSSGDVTPTPATGIGQYASQGGTPGWASPGMVNALQSGANAASAAYQAAQGGGGSADMPSADPGAGEPAPDPSAAGGGSDVPGTGSDVPAAGDPAPDPSAGGGDQPQIDNSGAPADASALDAGAGDPAPDPSAGDGGGI